MGDAKRGSKVRCWSFTSWEEEEPEWDEDQMEFLVYQRERGEEAKAAEAKHQAADHWQGYVIFKCRKRCEGAKLLLGSARIHMARAGGSPSSNVAYCTDKTKRAPGAGEPVKKGAIPQDVGQGSRTDLQRGCELAKEGSKRGLYAKLLSPALFS